MSDGDEWAMPIYDDDHEWRCPNCGAVTRARMADRAREPQSLLYRILDFIATGGTSVLRRPRKS